MRAIVNIILPTNTLTNRNTGQRDFPSCKYLRLTMLIVLLGKALYARAKRHTAAKLTRRAPNTGIMVPEKQPDDRQQNIDDIKEFQRYLANDYRAAIEFLIHVPSICCRQDLRCVKTQLFAHACCWLRPAPSFSRAAPPRQTIRTKFWIHLNDIVMAYYPQQTHIDLNGIEVSFCVVCYTRH